MKTKLFSLFIAVFLFSFSGNSQTCPSGWNPAYHCISLIGPGTPGGNWETDTYLSTVDGNEYTAVDMQFSAGEIKFRQDGCWETCAGNPAGWGPALSAETGWPSGANTNPVPNGPNIKCPGGVWNVKFTLSSQSWEFTPGTPNAVISIGGTAVSAGTVNMTTSDGKMYSAKKVTLVPGNLQFNVAGELWGGDGADDGVLYEAFEGVQTPVTTTGIDYDVTFDYKTYEYTFKVATFPAISIVGEAAGGWPGDPGNPGPIDTHQMTTTDGEIYTYAGIALTTFAPDGGIKFRQDNAWGISWGGQSFPTGPTVAGKNIECEAGAYNVVFTRSTGAYVFKEITYAIVGEAVGGWPGQPGNPGPTDVHQMSTVDGVNYTINNLVVTTATEGGGAKFRPNNEWVGDWGGDTFPAGTKTSGNIPTVAGTYNLTMNRVTGAYDFGTALSTKNFTIAGLKMYPNPTQNNWNISANEPITSVQVFDILGKSVYNNTFSSNEVSVSATKLTRGVYFAKISTAKGSSNVKLVKE